MSRWAGPGNWLHLTVTRGEASPQALSPVRVPLRDPVRDPVRDTVRGPLGVPPGASSRAPLEPSPRAPRRAAFRAEVTPGTDTRGTLLLCDPPQGHPHAAQACAELAVAEGDIGRIPATPGALCPMIYAPVTAAARGEWNGRPVSYTHTFANSCVMGAATGAVFALGE